MSMFSCILFKRKRVAFSLTLLTLLMSHVLSFLGFLLLFNKGCPLATESGIPWEIHHESGVEFGCVDE